MDDMDFYKSGGAKKKKGSKKKAHRKPKYDSDSDSDSDYNSRRKGHRRLRTLSDILHLPVIAQIAALRRASVLGSPLPSIPSASSTYANGALATTLSPHGIPVPGTIALQSGPSSLSGLGAALSPHGIAFPGGAKKKSSKGKGKKKSASAAGKKKKSASGKKKKSSSSKSKSKSSSKH